MNPFSLRLANKLAAAHKTHKRRIGSQYSAHPFQFGPRFKRDVTRGANSDLEPDARNRLHA